MDFTQNDRNPAKNLIGIGFVVLLHAFIVYALVTGLARQIVEVIKHPLETKVIEEVRPPPPPPPDNLPPPPKMAAPPPPFIPPPEVAVQVPVPEATITAVTSVKPDVPVFNRPTPVVDAPKATASVHIPAVVDSKNCEKPDYPAASVRKEEQGTVTLAFLIGLDGRVVDSRVEKSSGFPALDKAARAGLSLCKFKPGSTDGKPEQSWTKMQYVWKLD